MTHNLTTNQEVKGVLTGREGCDILITQYIAITLYMTAKAKFVLPKTP